MSIGSVDLLQRYAAGYRVSIRRKSESYLKSASEGAWTWDSFISGDPIRSSLLLASTDNQATVHEKFLWEGVR
jgi:hypothetical protein